MRHGGSVDRERWPASYVLCRRNNVNQWRNGISNWAKLLASYQVDNHRRGEIKEK